MPDPPWRRGVSIKERLSRPYIFLVRKVSASRWNLACTSTQICSATNICPHIIINQPITGICQIRFQTMTASWHNDMCNQEDAVGSTWILNSQLMRRRYVTKRRQTTSVRLHYGHGPWPNRSGCSCKQGLTCWLSPCVGRCPYEFPALKSINQCVCLLDGVSVNLPHKDGSGLGVCKWGGALLDVAVGVGLRWAIGHTKRDIWSQLGETEPPAPPPPPQGCTHADVRLGKAVNAFDHLVTPPDTSYKGQMGQKKKEIKGYESWSFMN